MVHLQSFNMLVAKSSLFGMNTYCCAREKNKVQRNIFSMTDFSKGNI